MRIDASNKSYKELNAAILKNPDPNTQITGCCGQRYIADGFSGKKIEIFGTPGNALGAYMDSGEIFVHGDVQDAVGDTMNDGRIYVDGMAGDAVGYAMRGGEIFIHGNVGYRAGIHMKAYGQKRPLMIVGGCAGSFLGEYQAGGTIVVLGLNAGSEPPVSYFCGMGMHGGAIYLRTKILPADLSVRIVASEVTRKDMWELMPKLEHFCNIFGENLNEILKTPFYKLTPDSGNPYKQLYVANYQ